jgi:CubicO group peptidase (beta-lactamase class C family)
MLIKDSKAGLPTEGDEMWRVRIIKTVLCLLLCYFQAARAGGSDLESITPEAAGWSSQKLNAAAEYASELGYSAIVMAYDGKVFFSWGEIERNYWCHSIRKPLLSSLYGIYVDNKTIDLDLTLEDLGIDDIPPALTPDEKKATVRQLLEGRSGVYHEAAAEVSSMVKSRPKRGSHAPGTFYYYNNWDFNVAGAIFRNLTGKDIFEEFKVQIADPIGMQDFDPVNCAYEYEREKSQYPAYKFRMSARDLARFGILYQKGGVWEGKRIIPEHWISESTTTYSVVDSTMGAGFGYMWGTILDGGVLSRLLGGTGLFFSGIGVHNLAIIDDLGLVLVLRFDTDGEWTPPPAGSSGKLYTMINAARIRADVETDLQ